VRVNGSAIDLRTAGGYIVLPTAGNGRSWIKPLATPLARVPKWVPPAAATRPHAAQEVRPFAGEATAYAQAALRLACDAIAAAPNGKQEATLNKECFSIGGLAGAGELDAETAIAALTAAAEAMTVYAEPWANLAAKVRRAVEEGSRQPRERPSDEHQTRQEERKADGLIWYGDIPPTPPGYLVDETIPEAGIAILGGQFGAAKTFVGADLVGAVIVGGYFAGKPVKRTGGVLWLAAEGETEIERRVYAAIEARGGDATQRQPFARQSGAVPSLTEKDALERLKALAAQAAQYLRANFNCGLALIAIDTLSAAAGFDDENSAAETQKVMTMLATLAREAQVVVLLVDHYGKLVDTGVRGSSAKSAAADAILACLGDRDLATGATSNRRLAVAKLRAGPTGRVIPFKLAQTADGLTCTVIWQADDHIEPPKAEVGRSWSKSLTIFRRALLEALASVGKTTILRAGMPEVRAVDREAVREEFFRLYPGETHKAKKDAFLRCAKDAVERGVLCSINVGPDLAQTIFWTP
jgi:AAA domain